MQLSKFQAARRARAWHCHWTAVDNSCVRCDKVGDLFSLVVELREEVERLRSIRDSEEEFDWWNHALASLRKEQPPENEPDTKRVLYPPLARLKAVDQKKGVNGGKPFLGETSESPSCPSPSQVPLEHRCEALDVEGCHQESS